MTDGKIYGQPWRDDELDAIVADYFAMLALELSRQRYVKAHHSAVLMERLGRSHRSVEFKHLNISAVLDELGLPWIPGYLPKSNYQNAIFDAIDRYLSGHSNGAELPEPTLVAPAPANVSVFVDPPAPKDTDRLPIRLQRLVRKFDPAARDNRNRSLGSAGEAFVLEVERKRLVDADRRDFGSESPLGFPRGGRRRGIRHLLIQCVRQRASRGSKNHKRFGTNAILS